MVRKTAYDVSEMAIVTYLQAKSHGKPLVLMPCVMLGRFQHGTLLYNSARGKLSLSDLRRPPRRRALLHPDHRHLAARPPAERLRRRHLSRELGQLRRRPCARISRPAVCRARRRRTRTCSRWCRTASSTPASSAPSCRPIRGSRASSTIPTRRPGAGAPSTASCRSITWWCVTESLSRSKPELVREVYRMLKQSKQAAGLPKPGEIDFHPVRGRGLPAGARDDHRLCGSAEADPAAVRRSTSCSTIPPGRSTDSYPVDRIRGPRLAVTSGSRSGNAWPRRHATKFSVTKPPVGRGRTRLLCR